MNLKQALAHAIDGHAVLFAGAGYSRGAIASNGQPLPVGDELANRLLKKVGYGGRAPDLMHAARYFEKKTSVGDLVEFLRDSFTISAYTDQQKLIASTPWKRIYTTNYDDLLERVFHDSTKPLVPVTLGKRVDEFASQQHIAVHLNGYVGDLTTASLDSELKLTSASYVSESVANSPWSFLLRSDIRAARATIFIGYSMADLDIARIIQSDTATRAKCVFVISPTADEIERSVLEDYGTVLAIGLEQFAKELIEALNTHVPAVEEPMFFCFDRISVPSAAPDIKDQDLFDFFLKGDFRDDLIWNTINNPGSIGYYVVREQVKEVLDQVEIGGNDVLVHADFANGKTALIQAVALEAASKGLAVYMFSGHGRSLAAEIDALARSEKPTLVIFENYVRLMTEVKQLRLKANSRVSILLAARTLDYEATVDDVVEARADRNLYEIDVNKLRASDEVKIADIFDVFGLWGDAAAKSKEEKVRLVKNKYDSEFQKILLDVLRAPQVVQRLRELTAGLAGDPAVEELIIALCALTILQGYPTAQILADLLDSEVARRSSFQRSPVVRRFVSQESGQVTMKSPVVARHLLVEVFSGDRTIEVLLKIARRSEMAASVEPFMKALFRLLHTFGNVQLMLPEKNRKASLIHYYEQLKNLQGCISNSFFWLQYAIARLSFQDYETAGRFFATAYALARKIPGFSPFQIDNHYARYLLERCVVLNDSAKSFEVFQEAKRLLNQQMTREHRYYPYRVARLYYDFYVTFFASWTSAQQKAFVDTCKFVLERIEKLKGSVRTHPYVREAKARISEIIRKVGA